MTGFKIFIILFAAVTLPLFSLAFDIHPLGGTGVDGGGGKSIVCRNSAGQIQKIELLDLFEGRIQYGLSYSESSLPWREQLEQILDSSGLKDSEAFHSGYNIKESVKTIPQHLVFLPSEARLLPIDDSLEVIAPVGCDIEQTVNYQNDRSILVDGTLWNAMSETQKAALILHEAIYKELRGWQETNSRRARHFTAFLFSGAKTDQGRSKTTVYCSGTDKEGRLTDFGVYTYPDNNSGQERLGFQFYNLGGRHLLAATRIIGYATNTKGLSSPQTLFLQFLKPTEDLFFLADTVSTFEGNDNITITNFQKPTLGVHHWHMAYSSAINDIWGEVDFTCQRN